MGHPVFVFGPEIDPEYICIRVKNNIPNIFIFSFGQKNIFATLCREIMK